MESTGRKLHKKAADAREKEQFTESLTFNDDALFVYDLENDALGFSEGIACRSITLRVYGNLHKSKRILTLAMYEMMASVDLARQSKSKEALALPLFNLAKLQQDLGELNKAIESYKEAVENMQKNPPEQHNRPSVLADMRVHLAVCEYKAGDKSALERAITALRELEDSEESSKYNKDVWVSGAYMRISEAVRQDDPGRGKEYLSKAKEIIDSNPDLTLVRKQWEKLSGSF